MAEYINNSKARVFVRAYGSTAQVRPGQIVHLPEGNYPGLDPVGGRQLLTEQPLAPAKPVIEEIVEKTVSIDVDGDGKADVEIKGSVVEEVDEKPKKRGRKKKDGEETEDSE